MFYSNIYKNVVDTLRWGTACLGFHGHYFIKVGCHVRSRGTVCLVEWTQIYYIITRCKTSSLLLTLHLVSTVLTAEVVGQQNWLFDMNVPLVWSRGLSMTTHIKPIYYVFILKNNRSFSSIVFMFISSSSKIYHLICFHRTRPWIH